MGRRGRAEGGDEGAKLVQEPRSMGDGVYALVWAIGDIVAGRKTVVVNNEKMEINWYCLRMRDC